jgi:hypothetical protein
MTRDEIIEKLESIEADAVMVSARLRENATDPMAWADSVEMGLRDLLIALRSRPAPLDELAERDRRLVDAAYAAGAAAAAPPDELAALREAAQVIYEAYGPAEDYTCGPREMWERLRDALAAPAPVAALVVEGRCTVCRDTALPCMTSHAGRRVPCPDCQTASMCHNWNGGQFRCIRTTAPVAAPVPHPAGGIRTDFRGSDGEMLAPTDEARKVISDCTARGAQLPDMHQVRSAITDIIVERNRQAGIGLRFRDVHTGVITDEFGREHPPSFEAKTHQDSLQNVAAPAPETPAPDAMPEIVVGDWVADIEDQKPYLVRYPREAAELNTPRLARFVAEVRGLRDGRAVSWRRQEAQP